MLQQDRSVELKETMGFAYTLVALTAAAIIYNVICLDVQNQNQKCETLPSQINVIKEEYDELGRLQRTCHGEIEVNKCEGSCSSQVQPSVITATGFLKECYCCRETFLTERIITLTHCYDPDGMRLSIEGTNTMDIKIKEPSNCKCFKCGDFSR